MSAGGGEAGGVEGGGEVEEEGDAGEDAVGTDGGRGAEDEAGEEGETAGEWCAVSIRAACKGINEEAEEVSEGKEGFAVGGAQNDTGG